MTTENIPPTESGTTDTQDSRAPQPETVTEEPERARPRSMAIEESISEDSPRGERDAPAETEGKEEGEDGEKPKPKPKAETKPAGKPRPRVAWVEDGDGHTLELRRESGAVRLSRDELEAVARRKTGRLADERRQADERARQAEERATRLEAELQAARSAKPTEPDPSQNKPPADRPWAVKGASKPVLGDFDDVEAWADARDEWRDAQRAPDPQPAKKPDTPAEAPDPEVDATALELTESDRQRTAEVVQAAMEKYADFSEVMKPDTPVSKAMMDFILESDVAPDLLYYFGQNPDVAQEIAALSSNPRNPTAADVRETVRVLTRLELTLGASPSGDVDVDRDTGRVDTGNDEDGAGHDDSRQTPRPTRRHTSEPPPPPPTPPKGKPSAGPRKSPEDMSPAEYEAWRNAGGGR